jgi:hypothetical protein
MIGDDGTGKQIQLQIATEDELDSCCEEYKWLVPRGSSYGHQGVKQWQTATAVMAMESLSMDPVSATFLGRNYQFVHAISHEEKCIALVVKRVDSERVALPDLSPVQRADLRRMLHLNGGADPDGLYTRIMALLGQDEDVVTGAGLAVPAEDQAIAKRRLDS